MISIIIPVLNEEKSIKETLMTIQRLSGEKEIIVVDGGSHDRTVAIAKGYATVIASYRGRARQMNAGAKVAKGDILWFVHSDSKVAPNSLIEIKKVIETGFIGGSFKLEFYDLNTPFMKFVASTSNARAKYLHLIFGDQGIFMKRSIFVELDGYKEMELMEDWDLSKRIHRLGKLKRLPIVIGTSARRFKQAGPLRMLLRMHKIKLLYLLGTPPEKLAAIYRQVRQ